MNKPTLYYIIHDKLEDYKITKDGDIWSIKRNKFISQNICNGYKTVTLSYNTYTVHRLVALTFIENPDNKPYVNHINCDKLDNNVKNLEWVTQKENTKLHNKQTSHPRRVIQLDKSGKEIKIFNSSIEAGKEIGLSPSAISKVLIKQNQTAGGFKWIYEDSKYEPLEVDLSKGKVIKNYPKYMVFPDGNIYNNVRKVFVKPIKNASGYCYVSLCNKGIKQNIYIHRIIADHFIENKENKPQVNHINKIRNDNRVENLEWVTGAENIRHARRV
jgi:hypothetical protein